MKCFSGFVIEEWKLAEVGRSFLSTLFAISGRSSAAVVAARDDGDAEIAGAKICLPTAPETQALAHFSTSLKGPKITD
ncbi:hypothetical protein [Oceanicoccus sagamiensis]|uniref:hypothetical protein n=1 Tax=Oceanicoccus sagamiensis TaxID=716816 RepID=UPI0012F4AAF8|nr:hypothetical protein [Oceanicoccus sagamiensis]